MTKKHFIALADYIRDAQYGQTSDGMSHVVSFTDGQLNLLANFCQSQNPNFNRERWLDYIASKCGKNGGKL